MDRIKKIDWGYLLRNYLVVFVAIVLFIVSSQLSDVFLSTQNIFNLLRQLAPPTLIAIGMLFVIMTGGIDLSVGSVVAMASVFTAHLLMTHNLVVTIVLVLLCTAVFGAVIGYLVAYRKLAAFVVSLAGMTIASGIAFIVSRGMPQRIRNDALRSFAVDSVLGVPILVCFALAFVLIFALIHRYTTWGRIVQAIGSNETAAKLSGINTNLYTVSVYVLSSVLAGIAGIMIASRVNIGSPLAGQLMELDAIAAVVIGGASLAGGNGKVLNTLMGVWVLGMIGNIMNLMNVPSYPQDVLKGVIIILAILLQMSKKGKDINSSSMA
ncbi:MAG: ABC transporter permease [Defluviitaleaceae bacterium]|nr:ABC transporter permease [Defluviitaleaceae bacterium]